MTSPAERAAMLSRALRAAIEGDDSAIKDICTDDITAWTPALSTTSRDELMAEIARRDDAFSDVQLDLTPLEVGGEYACAEWTVTMRHTGPLALAEGATVDATDAQVTLHGVTVAEFRGEQICSLRQYWDELTVFEQLGLLAEQ
jgi:ketosteroid isomerase-like protein